MKGSAHHRIFLIIGLLTSGLITYAQDSTNGYQKRRLDPVEVDILFGYYTQQGNHSAVTGGRGTEELTDYSPTILVNIPVDSNKALTLDVGIDAYTSASTDKIDYRVSSASYKDVRTHAVVGYNQKFTKPGLEAGILGSFSIESDYLSRGVGISLGKEMEEGNSMLTFKTWLYFDVVGWGWLNPDYFRNVKIIYPVELRDTNWFDDGRRNTYSFSLAFSRNMTKRMNMSIFTGFTYQEGLLSTPFHRVYFADQEMPRVEKLPSTRIKMLAGMRWNYFIGDMFVLRTHYRYYADSWEISSNTVSIEVPVKITGFFSVYPIYRYHTQKGTKYFAPYKQHQTSASYYTSDYDLSRIISNEIGAGLSLGPPMGIFRYKWSKRGRTRLMSSIDIRYVYYMRSDGMKSHAFSIGLSFGGF
jgi:hypothetical protein